MQKILKYLIIILAFSLKLYTQNGFKEKFTTHHNNSYDTLKKKVHSSKLISGIFISAGAGLSVPLPDFSKSANPSFGINGRIEYASTSIFPLIPGAEISYFTHNSPDEFRTSNLLNSFKTQILSAGVNLEYCLVNIIKSSFTIPFFTLDLKYNLIKRDYDENRRQENLMEEKESKISLGTGLGFTIFIFDFYGKYNYMKNNSYLGFYVKTKIPLIRF